jgi:predicted DNA-binding transcriptional regulator AlpA
MKASQTVTPQGAPRLIAIPETLYRTSLCKTALYERIKAGEFRPIKLGKKTVFAENEVREWIDSRIAGRKAT